MSPEFQRAVESLHAKFEYLIQSVPYEKGAILPKEGVYLFSENGSHFMLVVRTTFPSVVGSIPSVALKQTKQR